MEENLNTGNQGTSDTSNDCCTDKKCKCKCCCRLILNIITLLGVIVLFILYFTDKKTSSYKDKNSPLKIAYVNSDSVMAKYEMVKEMKTALLAKQKEAESSFTTRQQNFEAQVSAYQKNLKSLSISEAQNKEKALGQEQQNLQELKESLTQTLSEEEYKMNNLLQDSIINYLKRYNKKYHFDYVLGFSKGSGILVTNDNLEITKDIIDGLNKEYTPTSKADDEVKKK